jgi:UDP-2,3-diacylglucosamine hydrolase
MTTQRYIGLIAGWGCYPQVIVAALHRQNIGVCCVGVKDHADPALESMCEHFLWSGVAHLGQHMRFFRQHGVTQATMAGKIHKAKVLFRRWGWLSHLPDWTTLRTFLPHFVWGTKNRNDDSLLLAVVQAFAHGGIELAPATNFAPELLVKPGSLTKRMATNAQLKDIEFGWHMAKEMGRLDIGQTVVVKGRAVIAVEAVEGTDECIRRAGQLCPQGGFTVVKVAKPQQDMRFDVPTIGIGTLETVAKAGGSVLAVEAHKTILLAEPDFLKTAEKLGICVMSLTPESFENRAHVA